MKNPFRQAPALPEQAITATDALREARARFQDANYADAAQQFALAARKQAPFSAEEKSAWAYSRIRLAAESVRNSDCDSARARAAASEAIAAMQLAPENAEIRQLADKVCAVARQFQLIEKPVTQQVDVSSQSAGWEKIETASFSVQFHGSRELAEKIAQAAEANRVKIFERWSGPPNGVWKPRCEIILHTTATDYSQATSKPAAGTGFATVELKEGSATVRRIELRADDDDLIANSLPRELTHIVIADLFPFAPPPKWAEEGMALLGGSPDEMSRYLRTLPRCVRNQELLSLPTLLDLSNFPAAKHVTAFYCQSAVLVDYLVKLQGGARVHRFRQRFTALRLAPRAR